MFSYRKVLVTMFAPAWLYTTNFASCDSLGVFALSQSAEVVAHMVLQLDSCVLVLFQGKTASATATSHLI